MGRNRSVKRQNFEKREEEKANRLFKMICIVPKIRKQSQWQSQLQ